MVFLFFILTSLSCTTAFQNFRSKGIILRSSKSALKSAIEDLEIKCDECVRTSQSKYTNGSEYYSNPKSQMGSWIDEKLRDDVVFSLNDTILSYKNIENKNHISKLSEPSSIDIFHSNGEYSLTLYHITPEQSIPSYSHQAGTFLAYKALYGTGFLETRFSKFHRNLDTLDSFPSSEAMIVSKIGGPIRQLVNNFTKPCGILELAIYSPEIKLESTFQTKFLTQGKNTMGQNVSSFNLLNQPYISLCNMMESNHINGISGLLTIDLSNEEKISLFESYAEIQHQRQQAAIDQQYTNIYNATKVTQYESMVAEMAQKKRTSNARKPIKSFRNIPVVLSQNIGGLNAQLQDITRRLLYSRTLPPNTLNMLGLTHVSGLLLYGPPGTGKTLIARQLAAVLSPREPQIVNGPEILDKYVGEAERNIRQLFRPADDEWESRGMHSELHVIVFDEFDSIAKKRGLLAGDGSGVRDSVVNQLLTQMDGIKQRNNILIIALTNRKDLIDPALLRPGRFEVQINIPVPDRKGREEILDILFRPLIKETLISSESGPLWIQRLVSMTDGWTGADLTGLVRSATSFLTQRYFDSIILLSEEQQKLAEEEEAVLMQDNIRKDSNDIFIKSSSDTGVSSGVGGNNDDEKLSSLLRMELTWLDFKKAWIESSVDKKNIPRRLRFTNYIKSKFM